MAKKINERLDGQTFLPGMEPPETKEIELIKSVMPHLINAVEAQGGDSSSLSYRANKSGYSAVLFGPQTVFRVAIRGKQNRISVPPALEDVIPANWVRKKTRAGDGYSHLDLVSNAENEYIPLLSALAAATVGRYSKEWDCCSRYLECSDAKKCVHPDKTFAMACGYRKILNSGKIYYGKNRNVDTPKSVADRDARKENNVRYAVIDIETPNRNNDRISQFGLVLIENGHILKSDEILCDPEVPFDSINSQITGIKEEDVQGCMIFPQLWEKVSPYIDGSIVVAHGAHFDLNVLHKCFVAYNLSEPTLQYCDTQKMAKSLWPQLGHYGLRTICNSLGIELDHHHAGSDALAAAQVLIAMLRDGYNVEHDIRDFVSADQKHGSFWVNSSTQKKTSINNLIELLDSISSDGEISMDELLTLANWLISHEEFADKREFREVVELLNNILVDGIVDESEQDELLSLCHQLVDPIAASAPAQNIRLAGQLVCLTGDFTHGTKGEIEELLTAKGAQVIPRVTQKLNYLIVGSLGSDMWVTANYGTKVKKVLELQENGIPVQIIKEDDLFVAIGNMV